MTNALTTPDPQPTMGPLATLCLAAALTIVMLACTISAKTEGAEAEQAQPTAEQPAGCESQPRYCLACGGRHSPNAQEGLPCGN